jgi:hypothetical protein
MSAATSSKNISILAFALLSQSAIAHVTLDQPTAQAGAYHKLTFKVGHGCDGSATNSFTVSLPEAASGAKPMPKAGWKVETQSAPLTTPLTSHGKTISADVREVSWSGGSLPDAHYDEFSIQVKLSDTPGKLYFKVTQLCEQGRWDWVDIPKEGQSRKDLKAPAPVLDVQGKQEVTAEHKH